MDWGKFLRASRVQHGFKQSIMADVLGVDQATVSRWERGASAPTIAMQRVIMNRMNAFVRASGDRLPHLVDAMRNTSKAMGLSAEGEACHTIFLNRPAQLLIGVDQESLDWSEDGTTAQQYAFYTSATDHMRLFTDKNIYRAEVYVPVLVPGEGKEVMTYCTYYPIWAGGSSPHLLAELHAVSEASTERGRIEVHRTVEGMETITL